MCVECAHGANQTAALSPVNLSPNLPYRIDVRPVSFGTADLPTLQSYAVGNYDGKWLLISGRTNGLHGFNASAPDQNFPTQYQNRDVWVIDIANKQSWHRSLDDASSGLTPAQIASLAPVNNQFYQSGNELYMTGGYGTNELGNFVTFDTLSAINLPGLGNWVTSGNGTAAAHIRQIHDPLVQVTGGDMEVMNGKTHLVFGQDFEGPYVPNSAGIYTQQVRSFNIVDNGISLSIANVSSSVPNSVYRRRDLNIFPTIRPDGNGVKPGLDALSGVFTATNGVWTVPVEIDAAGNPTMADPAAAGTFKQGMNNYHSAKLGLYSEAAGDMHEVLFGGISLQYLNTATNSIVTDNNLPFINDITSIKIDAAGNYTQNYLGEFPALYDLANNRLRFGTNAEFLMADGIETFDNDVIKLDALNSVTTLGYIFGGIVANAPQVRVSPSTLSAASNQFFEVVYVPFVPGDYNHNGIVDAADYVVYRDTFGQTGTVLAADGNGNGAIDTGDYDIWRAHFGEAAGSGSGVSANSAVPEPATPVLLILAAGVICLPGRRCA